ncbi:hypothetical protein GE061_003050 [Apolygus lucorum]|uniref:Uncharacterized protein n=1 Tax=Apolygus lucorum TaxID=248454 RepID=A0A6A4JIB2_APOLU|nr:hypothetical protein GE061_003050 [Apolygus lucorum]
MSSIGAGESSKKQSPNHVVSTIHRHQLFLLEKISAVSKFLRFIWSDELENWIEDSATETLRTQHPRKTTRGMVVEIVKTMLFGYVTLFTTSLILTNVGNFITKYVLTADKE